MFLVFKFFSMHKATSLEPGDKKNLKQYSKYKLLCQTFGLALINALPPYSGDGPETYVRLIVRGQVYDERMTILKHVIFYSMSDILYASSNIQISTLHSLCLTCTEWVSNPRLIILQVLKNSILFSVSYYVCL